MIRVNLYFRNGNLQSSHDCKTDIEAFTRLQCSGMHGLAHPVEMTCGGYYWDPSKMHTMEGFRNKLALCCNDPAEYSRRLISAGICRTPRCM